MTFTVPEATRVDLDLDVRRLSFLDFGGPGRPLLALHGHFSKGRAFARSARALTPDRRVVASGQRGHGESGRPSDHHRRGCLADAVAVLDHLGLGAVVVLGHSLGGVNTYQLAVRDPDRVLALGRRGHRSRRGGRPVLLPLLAAPGAGPRGPDRGAGSVRPHRSRGLRRYCP
ncbi:alpha/beta hydrolase [Streptomyces sp. NPDC006261]|uniref:alpha/beta fold hydrolase n=1 Tax=Streptomyces sp. NPDC006261 TaxID=3156739 RepID=UPI0033B805B2